MTPSIRVPDWIEITTPPQPYIYAVRRSFPGGLHVLVLAQKRGGNLAVLSSVDHGTARGTRITEGMSGNLDEIARLIAQTCAKWNTSEATAATPADLKRRRYYYSKPTGEISAAFTRDHLFDLVSNGTISWGSQVWQETENSSDGGEWIPLTASLGFPQDSDTIIN